MSKVNREKRKKQIETSLEKLSQIGLIGESHETDTGEKVWAVEPKHFDLMVKLLKHPERWDEVPALAKRKTELYRLREQAIAKGLIVE